MPRLRDVAIALLAVTAVVVPAAAYQIGSNVPKARFHDLHETFTAVAKECLGDRAERPDDCSSFFPQALQRTRIRELRPGLTEEHASRWPDDPTRMLDLFPSKIRIGLQFDSDCRRALRGSRAIDVAGLLCSSHYGRLQFMHAQARQEDREEGSTRANILAWARFAFRAATDRTFRDMNYCDAIATGIDHDPLRAALTFDDPSWCKDRPKRLLGLLRIGTYPAWTVRTLFALHCPNPVQEKSCWVSTAQYGDDRARLAAVGALLHLVQDSYSQSHVARVPADQQRTPGPRGPFKARVVCSGPSRYYDYEEQNAPTRDDLGNMPEDPHAEADVPPREADGLDRSCLARGRAVDDIITASAAVLHFVRKGDETGFRTYMETRVFPS